MAAGSCKKYKKNKSKSAQEWENVMWAWKAYVEPEGSQFGKCIKDYSPAWFMQT